MLQFTLQLYHNTTIVLVYQNVYPEVYFEYRETTSFKNRLSYFRFSAPFGKDEYHNFIYDIANMKLMKMDDSTKVPSFYIDFKVINNNFDKSYRNIVNNFESKLKMGSLSIVFHSDNSKTSAIIAEFVKDANEYEILENIFVDDDTKNIKVTYKDRPEDVRFLYYCFNLNKNLLGGAIFEKGISEYIIGTQNYIKEYKLILTSPQNEIDYYKMMVKELYKRCNEPICVNRLPQKLYENYIESFRMLNILHRYCYAYDNIWEVPSFRKHKLPFQNFIIKNKSKIFEKEKIKYDDIYQQLIKSEKLPVRWKNEYALYKLVSKIYPDSIYQYHCSWLGRQSLDIFVPSENLAFEYQGEQHYHPIDFWGGESGFAMRIKLDEKKRKLCEKNNVKLVEWKYDEPLTKKALNVKLI